MMRWLSAGLAMLLAGPARRWRRAPGDRAMMRWLSAGLVMWLAGPALAAGSWVAEPPALRLAMADRESVSAPLMAPPGVAGGAEITRIRWRLEAPPGDFPALRLCQQARCAVLSGPRGTTEALAGAAADAPLRLQGRLPEGRRQAMTLSGIQLIIEYR